MAQGIKAGVASVLLVLGLVLVLLPAHADAFGAGNIASISTIEGKNWRHGDIEDVLMSIACIKGLKWTSTTIKRVYFGNWLRDYSQAMDVGTLKSVQADTIRILVWILSFMTFGYATAEFEVTSERLGVYRPEEHIDNPKGYADDQDARQCDPRLRPPVRHIELEIDPHSGMKNYIANERGEWATSSSYVKHSLSRSIHYGRLYTQAGRRGNEADLCEALRCLGQGLHTLEDFAAHTNYCELALREMGFRDVFPHTGTATQINLRGHHVFPLVTGTFGMVDFFHSMLGEATDHFTQSEVNEMDIALGDAQDNSSSGALGNFLSSLKGVPGTGDLVSEAERLKGESEAQSRANNDAGFTSYGNNQSRGLGGTWSSSRDMDDMSRAEPSAQSSQSGQPGMPDIDTEKIVSRIYPILAFRDKVVRRLTSILEKIPGLEALVEKISETVTVFVMSLLAPFIRPLIKLGSQSLQTGSSGVIHASGEHQFEPWTDPSCTDPTHSLLSKDHFSNVLNEPAGQVASEILKYAASRVLYAWEHTDFPVHQVMEDCLHVFHHPALRDMQNEAHRNMFEAVQQWVQAKPDRAAKIDDVLSAEGVKAGKNTGGQVGHSHGGGHSQTIGPQGGGSPVGGYSQDAGPHGGGSYGGHSYSCHPQGGDPYDGGSGLQTFGGPGGSSDFQRNTQPSPEQYTATSSGQYHHHHHQPQLQSDTSASYHPATTHYSEYGAHYAPNPVPDFPTSSGYGHSSDYYQSQPQPSYGSSLGYGHSQGHAHDYNQSHHHHQSHGHGHNHGYGHPRVYESAPGGYQYY